MLRGIGAAASGLVADEQWQQVLANNLAQLNTPGYKAEAARIGSFRSVLIERTGPVPAAIGYASPGAELVATVPDLSQGPLQETGNPLDVAIQGQGFFAVQTPQGVRYTRAGDFSLDAAGQLATPQGYLVLSAQGTPLQAGPGAAIDRSGRLVDAAGPVGSLGVYAPAPAQLTDMGGGLFAARGPVAPYPAAALVPGALEGSNVSAPETLAAMIQVLRQFQAGQQFVLADKKTLDRFLEVAS